MSEDYGYGYGYGSGAGDGAGAGYGSGAGYGYGSGAGSGYGDAYGEGKGWGVSRDEETLRQFWQVCAISGAYGAKECLLEKNQEMRRIMIECLGADRFFAQANAKVIHSDIDGCGNPRQLVRLRMKGAGARGHLMAVHVVCPTTKRTYYLGVHPGMKTCQEAVAITFGLKPSEYQPIRES